MEEGTTLDLYCPLAYQCGCKVQMKLVSEQELCAIYRHSVHEVDSHKINKCKYLNASQKLHLEHVTRTKPTELPSTIRR